MKKLLIIIFVTSVMCACQKSATVTPSNGNQIYETAKGSTTSKSETVTATIINFCPTLCQKIAAFQCPVPFIVKIQGNGGIYYLYGVNPNGSDDSEAGYYADYHYNCHSKADAVQQTDSDYQRVIINPTAYLSNGAWYNAKAGNIDQLAYFHPYGQLVTWSWALFNGYQIGAFGSEQTTQF